MQIDPYILAFSAVTVIATIFMGFWSARRSKTASDFFVAGRSVSVGWNASAISGEYLSAASFMGVAGMVMSSGYDALWYPVCYACGYLFLLLFIAGPLRRFGAYTIPDFAEGRFDSPVFRKIAVCFVLFIGFFYTMPQMKGAGTTLAYIFPGLPYWAGVVLVGAVITLNVALGGMKGITLVQAFQYWAKMFAISVPIFVLMAVYGHYGKQLGANKGSESAAQVSIIESSIISSEQLTNYFQELHFVWSHSPKVDPATILKHVGLNRVGVEAVAREALNLLTFDYVTNPVSLNSLIAGYSRATGLKIWAPINDPALRTNWILNPLKFENRSMLIETVSRLWETNGFHLVSIGPDEVALLSTDSVSRIPNATARKQLPDKAPADATWLSPFGPLTTKAARAAATPRTRSDFELISTDEAIASQINVLGQRIYAPNLFAQIERLKAVFQKPPPRSWRTMIPSASSNVIVHMPAPLLAYGAAVGKPVLWQTNMAIHPFALDVSHTAETTDAEMAARLESALRSNGVSLVTGPHNTIIAVNATDLQQLRDKSDVQRAAIAEASIRPYALLYTYSLIIALVCGTAGLPHILVRFYTNPDGVAAKRTTMWVMILIGIFYVFPPVFGVMGRNLFPELYAGIGAKGTDKIVLELPRLLNEEYAPLGSILSGITCAGAFAAFMSTFSGLLVSMTGAMAHDVYGRMLRPKATSAQRMRMFKIAAVLIGGVAMLLGSFVEALEINFMVGQAFAIAAASYFPLLFMAAWWRNLTMKGAATGMLAGGLSAVLAISLTSFSTLASAPGRSGEIFAVFQPLNDFWAQYPLLRILAEQPAIWAVPLAIGLMIVVSKLTRKDVPSDIRMKMLVLHAPEKLGLKQEYIQEHQHGH